MNKRKRHSISQVKYTNQRFATIEDFQQACSEGRVVSKYGAPLKYSSYVPSPNKEPSAPVSPSSSESSSTHTSLSPFAVIVEAKVPSFSPSVTPGASSTPSAPKSTPQQHSISPINSLLLPPTELYKPLIPILPDEQVPQSVHTSSSFASKVPDVSKTIVMGSPSVDNEYDPPSPESPPAFDSISEVPDCLPPKPSCKDESTAANQPSPASPIQNHAPSATTATSTDPPSSHSKSTPLLEDKSEPPFPTEGKPNLPNESTPPVEQLEKSSFPTVTTSKRPTRYSRNRPAPQPPPRSRSRKKNPLQPIGDDLQKQPKASKQRKVQAKDKVPINCDDVPDVVIAPPIDFSAAQIYDVGSLYDVNRVVRLAWNYPYPLLVYDFLSLGDVRRNHQLIEERLNDDILFAYFYLLENLKTNPVLSFVSFPALADLKLGIPPSSNVPSALFYGFLVNPHGVHWILEVLSVAEPSSPVIYVLDSTHARVRTTRSSSKARKTASGPPIFSPLQDQIKAKASLPGTKTPKRPYTEFQVGLLKAVLAAKCKYLDVPQQDNSTDCGIFVAHFAKVLALSNTPVDQITVPPISLDSKSSRLQLAEELLTGRLGSFSSYKLDAASPKAATSIASTDRPGSFSEPHCPDVSKTASGEGTSFGEISDATPGLQTNLTVPASIPSCSWSELRTSLTAKELYSDFLFEARSRWINSFPATMSSARLEEVPALDLADHISSSHFGVPFTVSDSNLLGCNFPNYTSVLSPFLDSSLGRGLIPLVDMNVQFYQDAALAMSSDELYHEMLVPLNSRQHIYASPDFEISNLNTLSIRHPSAVRNISWVERFMIKKTHPKPGYRHLHMHYLVLAQDGAALEWTVNPTATASWVYLSQGSKIYFLVPDLYHNDYKAAYLYRLRGDLVRYQAACAVLFKNSTFVALTPGKMLFLPPGTIYSAFSCVDSISFAGLFFSSYQCSLHFDWRDLELFADAASGCNDFGIICWTIAKAFTDSLTRGLSPTLEDVPHVVKTKCLLELYQYLINTDPLIVSDRDREAPRDKQRICAELKQLLLQADVLPVETLSPTKSFMAATEFTVEGQLVPREIPKVEACHVCNRALDHTDEGEAPHLLSHATVYFQESSTLFKSTKDTTTKKVHHSTDLATIWQSSSPISNVINGPTNATSWLAATLCALGEVDFERFSRDSYEQLTFVAQAYIYYPWRLMHLSYDIKLSDFFASSTPLAKVVWTKWRTTGSDLHLLMGRVMAASALATQLDTKFCFILAILGIHYTISFCKTDGSFYLLNPSPLKAPHGCLQGPYLARGTTTDIVNLIHTAHSISQPTYAEATMLLRRGKNRVKLTSVEANFLSDVLLFESYNHSHHEELLPGEKLSSAAIADIQAAVKCTATVPTQIFSFMVTKFINVPPLYLAISCPSSVLETTLNDAQELLSQMQKTCASFHHYQTSYFGPHMRARSTSGAFDSPKGQQLKQVMQDHIRSGGARSISRAASLFHILYTFYAG